MSASGSMYVMASVRGLLSSAYIASFLATGGALLGLAGYLLGVRRYGPVPMAGVVLGGVAAAFLTQWLGPVLTGQGGFNSKLNTSKPGALLRAPIGLGAHGALALWPVAAAFVAGGLELVTVMRARQRSQAGGPGARAVGRHAQRAVRGQPSQPSQPSQPDDGPWPESRLRPHSDEPAVRGTGTGSQQRFPADPEDGAQSPPLARPAGAHQQWPGGPSGQAGRVGGDSAEVPPDRDG